MEALFLNDNAIIFLFNILPPSISLVVRTLPIHQEQQQVISHRRRSYTHAPTSYDLPRPNVPTPTRPSSRRRKIMKDIHLVRITSMCVLILTKLALRRDWTSSRAATSNHLLSSP